MPCPATAQSVSARGLSCGSSRESSFKLLTPDEKASTYMFNKHVIRHRFCPKCGMHPYGEGTDPKGNDMAAINIRCLEDIELEKVPVTKFDGRAL